MVKGRNSQSTIGDKCIVKRKERARFQIEELVRHRICATIINEIVDGVETIPLEWKY